jgi:uroporphyrinogen decarboxylase
MFELNERENDKEEKMTSRDRVLATLNHKEPDRVPIDFGGTAVTGIAAIAYHRLKEYLGIQSGHTRIIDITQQLAQPEDEILDRFHVDVLDIGRAYNVNDEDWYDVNVYGTDVQYPVWFKPSYNEEGYYEIIDEGIVLARMPKNGYFFDQTYYPYLEGYPEDFSNFPTALRKTPGYHCPPPPFDNMKQKRFWQNLRETAKRVKEQTKKILTINVGGGLFESGYGMRRLDKFLIDIFRNPSQVEKFIDVIQEFNMATLSIICKNLGDVIDIIRIGDDLGGNDGPFFSPQTYRNLFKPYLTEMCDYIKKHSSMKIFFHSCGSIYPLIPDLIEAGIDILNPVQINIKYMEPKKLKAEFGDSLTFWGAGADVRNVVSRKTPSEIKKHVQELLDIYSPGGGFVWGTIHNITPEILPQNIVAMFEAVQEYNDQNSQ